MASDNKSFMSKFIATHSVAQDAIDHFSTTWLSPILRNPSYEAIPTFSRVLKPTGEDYFFSTTIRTPSTIPHLISLKLKDFKAPLDTAKGHSFNKTTDNTAQHSTGLNAPVPENPDCLMLLSLGPGGLDGHPATMHGGMLCAILDEMMGLVVMLNYTAAVEERTSVYTVKLETTYRAPVPTPSDVLVKAWVTRREGRKYYSRGQIVNQDGLVMTEAEGMWVETKRKTSEVVNAGGGSKL